MRVVLDTSTVVSGLLWNGPPYHILDLARRQRFELWTSLPLLTELADVLSRPKFAQRLQAAQVNVPTLVAGYTALAQLIKHPLPISRVCRDPDDDQVLACGVAARADLIITGDRDLLSLGHYMHMPILDSANGLAIICSSRQP